MTNSISDQRTIINLRDNPSSLTNPTSRTIASQSTQEPQPDEITPISPAGFHLPDGSGDSSTSAEEAAWQILKPFINPIDCNFAWTFEKQDGEILTGIRPLNLNTTMNALINGEMVDLAVNGGRKV